MSDWLKDSRTFGEQAWRCGLCWRLTGAVFLSIVLIEAAILAPSYRNYERDLLLALNQSGQQAARAALPTAGEMPEAALDYLVERTLIQGIRIDNETAPAAGTPLTTAPEDDQALRSKRRLSEDGNWMEVRWQAEDLGVPWDVVARLDTSHISTELAAFVWRIAGLVLLITAVVTVTTMLVLTKLILRPLLAFRSRITAAGQDPSHPSRYLAKDPGQDEMGDTERAFNDMLHQSAGYQAELERLNHELARFPDENTNPVMRASRSGELLYANEAAGPLLYCWQAKPGQPLPNHIQDLIAIALNQQRVQRYEEACEQNHFMVHFRPVADDAVNLYGLDITDRKRYEEELRHRTWNDELTGLSNRAALEQRLTQVIAMVGNGRGFALLMAGLDGFHAVNMTAGRDGGDAVLRETAQRLTSAAPEQAMVARMTGDVFAVLLLNCPVDEEGWVSGVARKLVKSVATPFKVKDNEYRCGLSVGITLCPADGTETDQLLRNAEMAMLRAKADRKSADSESVAFFVPDLSERMTKRHQQLAGLRHALDNDGLALWYQTQQAAHNQETIGVEALVRWPQSDGSMISPGEFIPLAEETGLIVPLGRWVLRTAIEQAAIWHRQGNSVRMAVNLSAQHLLAPGLVQEVSDLLTEHELPPSLLELEVTETAVIENLALTTAALEKLVCLGISIAVDDFGTGYSSLVYLKQLPVQRVKIDQAFVRGLPDNTQDAMLCRAIIGLAHNLGYEVIGEGVETAEQAAWLAEEGCDELQGFHFSRPQPAMHVLIAAPSAPQSDQLQ